MSRFEDTQPDLMAALASRGYRVTAPRRAIANLVGNKQDGFSVEELGDELPWVGRATVYRTIKIFLEAGVVCKLATLDGSHIYSRCELDHHHHHAMCVECGSVEEFGTASIEGLISVISAGIPGEVVDHRLELFVNCGLCPANAG